MIPRINTYVCKLTSKDSVAEKWLDVSVRYTFKTSCIPPFYSTGEITITPLRYGILIQKIIFLLQKDFIASVVLDKTLRHDESLLVVVEFPISYDFDKMIIVTDKGDFLFCCDEQTKQKIVGCVDYKEPIYRPLGTFLIPHQ